MAMDLNQQTDRTVYGYFSSEEAAESAVRELRDVGFTRSQISLAGRPDSDLEAISTDHNSRVEAITGNTSNAYEGSDFGSKAHHAGEKAGHAAGGFWQRVRNMFEGDPAEPYADENTRGDMATHEVTSAYDYDPDDFHRSWGNDDATGRSQYFSGQYGQSGQGVLVRVDAADRRAEAEEILESNGADLGRSYEDHALAGSGTADDFIGTPTGGLAGATSGAYATGSAGRNLNTDDLDTGMETDLDTDDDLVETSSGDSSHGIRLTEKPADVNRPQRIQLYGEVLRVHRDRIQRGEVRVRKEVVTEMQSVQVPVTREELVVERIPVQGEQAATGASFGQEKEIRIPLHEERVSFTREPVVREQVEIGKREVTDTETREESVRREELRVEDDSESYRKAS